MGREKKILHYEAQQFFFDAFIDSTIGSIDKYSTEDVTLYLFVLHKNGYFNYLPIPFEAFSIDHSSLKYYQIGEVYAKYIMFYNYLKKETETISKTLEHSKNNTSSSTEIYLIKAKKKKDIEISKLHEMFLPEHTGKYKVLIEFLTNENPYNELKSMSKIKGIPLTTAMLHNFKSFNKPFIHINNDDFNNLKLTKFYNAEKSIAASIFLKLKERNLLVDVGISRLYQISNKTFNTDFTAHNHFSNLKGKGITGLYMEFFETALDMLFT